MFVIFDKIPGLSSTSKRKYAEKSLKSIFSNFSFFLSLFEREKGNLIFPLNIEDISEIKAEVVAAAPALHPELCFDQLVYRQLLQHLILHLY